MTIRSEPELGADLSRLHDKAYSKKLISRPLPLSRPLGINSRLCMKLDLVHDRDGCDVGLLKGQSVATGTIIQASQ